MQLSVWLNIQTQQTSKAKVHLQNCKKLESHIRLGFPTPMRGDATSYQEIQRPQGSSRYCSGLRCIAGMEALSVCCEQIAVQTAGYFPKARWIGKYTYIFLCFNPNDI